MDKFNKIKADHCCFFIPLRIGAFIVAAWIFIWNLYLGIFHFLTAGFNDFGSIYTRIVGVLYLFVALIAFYGAHGIYNENPNRVALFAKFFLYSIIFNIGMSILSVISLSIAAAKDKGNCEKANPNNTEVCDYKFPVVSWLINFVIGVIIEVYLYIVIRSYKRELFARVSDHSDV
ncbi:unnamed protein product [Rhizophagus irregularis]|uniref:Uncharacterized protein n=3 Tax=Rhizophagus irregularis TaxID=588596 RepID=A0A916E9M3_9GLOM|nr:hypothetical protein RirG_072030 [Rhizophagus irregularis DAOM 197198w]UZO29658.1 hypothetical protein OCT59_023120 [Rhizophagus irregularis]GBC35087.1 hypothetical protein GLOIN_2v782378 [Rhizophagus irregularis DAOM 181602=DAOM 197198]CAB4422980.1 unnamed protein product [Rhizophagus irregularis]CAB4423261.1 unnamed protein product [Rhizophagus irregularis]